MLQTRALPYRTIARLIMSYLNFWNPFNVVLSNYAAVGQAHALSNPSSVRRVNITIYRSMIY